MRCVLGSGLDDEAEDAQDPLESEETRVDGPIRRIGAYRLLGTIGRGGMGEVYGARHERLDRIVAIKALPTAISNELQIRERFVREAKMMSALNHPNIVTVHDLIADRGRDYIVMERVDGETLSATIARSPLEIPLAVRILRQVASGLVAAHAAGIVHRDLKPSNVMVTPSGLVKVMDFGLAKLSDEEPRLAQTPGPEPLTRAGAVLGTAQYMSPEQTRGEGVAAPSDIFSWGALAYEIVSGTRPFPGDDRIAVMHGIRHAEPQNLLDLRAETPPALVDLIHAALRKSPAERPTAIELLEALERIERAENGTTLAAGAQASTRTGTSEPSAPGTQPLPRRLAIALALLAALSALVWLALWATTPPHPRVASLEDGEGTPHAFVEKGQLELARYDRPGAIDRAIGAFQQALGIDSSYAPAYAGLGWAYYHRFRESFDSSILELALANAQTAVDESPHLALGHVYLGAILGEKGEREAALAAIQDALEIEPENATAYRELAQIELQNGERAAAERAARRAVELEPAGWRHHAMLGTVLYQSGRYEEAEAEFRRWGELANDSWRPHANLAAVLQKLGRYDEAIAALQLALQHEPTAVVYTNLGTLYYFRGLYTRAVDAFQRAVEIKPGEPLHWANLGDGYRQIAGRESEATAAYRRAIQLLDEEITERPTDATLQSRLALYLAKKGERARAHREIARALELEPESPSVLYRATIAWEVSGEREEALRTLAAALEAGYPLDEFAREAELEQLRRDRRYHEIVGQWAAEPSSSAEPMNGQKP